MKMITTRTGNVRNARPLIMLITITEKCVWRQDYVNGDCTTYYVNVS